MKKIFLLLFIMLIFTVFNSAYAIIKIDPIDLEEPGNSIEQYYINGKQYVDKGKHVTNSKNAQIIKTYEEYKILEQQDIQIKEKLKEVIEEDFFVNNCLIVLQDRTYFAKGVSGHVSKLDITGNIANITIKRNPKARIVLENDYKRTYFIPVASTNITSINITYGLPNNSGYYFNRTSQILSFSIFVISILYGIFKKIKIKKNINDPESIKKRKSINRRVILGIIVSAVLYYLYLTTKTCC